jgi:glycogen synthase
MKILYISNEYPPETGLGGIGTYTKYCAEGMAARGHTVHVLCRSPSQILGTTIQSGVNVHRIAAGRYPLPSGRLFFPLRKFCRSKAPRSLVRLAWAKQVYETYKTRLCLQIKFDIIEYPECGGEGYYFYNVVNVVKVVRLHTPWEIVRKLDKIRQARLDTLVLSHCERSAARHASFITSPSRALAETLKHTWHLPEPTIIANPIVTSGFKMATGEKWLFLGRVEYRKGAHILIQAYTQLCRLCRPPVLQIVGRPYGKLPDGSDYEDYISNLLSKVPDSGKIEWVRGVEYQDVHCYLQDSSVAIFPSLWENMSYSCLEAMASGLAVVASNCGGFPEMISHNKTGVLVKPCDIAALAEALVSLRLQPESIKVLGNNARRHVQKNFDASRICSSLEALYNAFILARQESDKIPKG